MQHQGLSIFYASAFTDGLFLCLRKIPQFKSCNHKHVYVFLCLDYKTIRKSLNLIIDSEVSFKEATLKYFFRDKLYIFNIWLTQDVELHCNLSFNIGIFLITIAMLALYIVYCKGLNDLHCTTLLQIILIYFLFLI